MGITLKIQDGINNVLQHPRTSEMAVFGHVPHHQHANATGFSVAGKLRSTLTHLRNRIGSEKEDLYCLTSYNINREWKQALAAAGDADEEGVIAAVLLGVEMELLDVDDDVDA